MSVSKNSVSLFFGKLISSVCSLIIIALLSRFLSQYEYAVYRQWTIASNFILNFLSLGIPSSLNYFLAGSKDQRDSKSWQSNIFLLTMVISIILLFLAKPISIFSSWIFKNKVFHSHSVLFSGFIGISLLSSLYPNLLVIREKRKALFIISALPNAVFLGMILTLAILGVKSSIPYIYLLLVQPLLSIFVGLVSEKYLLSITLTDLCKMKKVISFAVPLGISNMVSSILVYTDKFVVGKMLSPEEFAVFVNGAYEIPFIALFSSSLFSILMPKLTNLYSSGEFGELKRLWIKSGKTLIPVMFTISSSLVCFAPTFVEVLFSKKYMAATPLFMIYQMLLIIRIYVYSTIFIASGKTKLYMVNSIISATLNFLLDILFIKLFGVMGVAFATVISTFVLMCLQITQIKRLTVSKTISEIFPVKEFLLGLPLSFGIQFLISFPLYLLNAGIIFLFLGAAIGSMLSFILLSRIISSDILDFLQSYLWKQIKKLC